MVAENVGGGDVNANRPEAEPWETFTLRDLNGGEVRDGEPNVRQLEPDRHLAPSAARAPRRGLIPRDGRNDIP